jgi:uncharacterized protein YdaU (DUF1376 family)
VNYYRTYPGDDAAATSHLTLEEIGAYKLIRDCYFSREGPLPADFDLYRLTRAVKRSERRAVMRVADEFFPLIDGVRRSAACDRELADAARKIATARENGRKSPGRPRTDEATDPITGDVTDRASDEVTNQATDEVTNHVTDEVTNRVTDEGTNEAPDGKPTASQPLSKNIQHHPRPSASREPARAEVSAGKAARLPRAWWESQEGVIQAGKILDVHPRRGESPQAFKLRVEQAAVEATR